MTETFHDRKTLEKFIEKEKFFDIEVQFVSVNKDLFDQEFRVHNKICQKGDRELTKKTNTTKRGLTVFLEHKIENPVEKSNVCRSKNVHETIK